MARFKMFQSGARPWPLNASDVQEHGLLLFLAAFLLSAFAPQLTSSAGTFLRAPAARTCFTRLVRRS